MSMDKAWVLHILQDPKEKREAKRVSNEKGNAQAAKDLIEDGRPPLQVFTGQGQMPKASVRTFDTGATRDTAEGKNDYEGFLSPLVLESYGDYMTEHRIQGDGSLRAADNWQKGIPIDAYRSSLIRHVFTAWRLWRGYSVKEEKIGGVLRQPTLIETLNGVLFNTMGLLHELLKQEQAKPTQGQGDYTFPNRPVFPYDPSKVVEKRGPLGRDLQNIPGYVEYDYREGRKASQ